MKGKILHPDESYAIMGACFQVHNEVGCGFTEEVYQECLEYELSSRKIAFEAQRELQITYRGHTLRKGFRPDLIVAGKIIVELKALASLAGEHRAQLINYLKASGMELGLLVNFGSFPKLEYERLIWTSGQNRPRASKLNNDVWEPIPL